MAPKKGAKMSLSDFRGDAARVEFMPSRSEGLDFAKGAGKGFGGGGGFGDRDDGGFGGKGKGKGRFEASRADDGDWFAKERTGGGGGGFGGGGKGLGDRDRGGPPSRGDDDNQWRTGGGGGGGGGQGMRDGGSRFGGKGKEDDRDWGRGGGMGDRGPSERRPLALKPRSVGDDIRAQMSGGGGGGGGQMKGYVPPALRKQQEERASRELQENADRKRRDAEEDRRRREQEDAEEDEQREEAKKQALAEAKQAKILEEKRKKKKAKDEEKRAAREASGLKFNAEDEPSEEELRLQEFESKVEAAIGAKGDTKKFAGEVTTILEQEDLQTPVPVKHLFRPILDAARGQDDDFVTDLVQRFVPVIHRLLVEAEDVWRYKMKFLAQVATAAAELKLPRLSPKTSLLEAIFDGLYQTELFEEQYFKFWSVWDDDRNPSKTMAVFQVQPFLEFLENGRIEGEEYEDDQEFKVLQGTFAYGDDLEEAVMTVEQAKRRAVELGDHCQGFVFEGEYNDTDMFEVVFMAKDGWELTQEESEEYTTVMKASAEDTDSESGEED